MGAFSTTPAKVDSSQIVQEELQKNAIVVFSGTQCVWCHRLRDLLQSHNLGHATHTILLDKHPQGNDLAQGLFRLTAQRTIPNVFVGGQHIKDGYSGVKRMLDNGEFVQLVEAAQAKRQ